MIAAGLSEPLLPPSTIITTCLAIVLGMGAVMVLIGIVKIGFGLFWRDVFDISGFSVVLLGGGAIAGALILRAVLTPADENPFVDLSPVFVWVPVALAALIAIVPLLVVIPKVVRKRSVRTGTSSACSGVWHAARNRDEDLRGG